MPVKLSGDLVAEARHSAKLFHRSLTGQIEHWATLGRALESRLSGDALAPLLATGSDSLKITQVAEPGQRQQVMAILAEFLDQEPETANHPWLAELGAQGIPLYGTKSGSAEIFRRDPDGKEMPVPSPVATAGR